MNRSPRLTILSQYFVPEMGAPQVRLSELGAALVRRGWQVEVLTALPNYPTGKVFPGYSPWKTAREEVDGMTVTRVPLWPSKTGMARRMVSYLSFAATAALLGPRHRSAPPPDLLLVESPPLTTGLAARWLAWRWGCPYVLNVSDLWPESFLRVGALKPGLLTGAAERFERSLYRHAAAITGQSQEIIDHVRGKSPGTPTRVVTNGCDPARFGPEQADEEARALLGGEPGPVFLYAGLLGIAQGLDQLLDLAAALPPETPGRLVLVGDGPMREPLRERLERERIPRVKLLPAQPRERIPALLAAADGAIISLVAPIPGAVPSKIYEAMASQLPILLVAEGEPTRRVEEARAGLAVRPGDAAGMLAAFTRLATEESLRQRLGSAGRRAAETTYHRDHIAEGLHHFLLERLPEAHP
jgi:glycosyltransferase involved in cell wall biosynthesis